MQRRRHGWIARDDAIVAAGLLPGAQTRGIPDFERQRAVVSCCGTAFLDVQDIRTISVNDLQRPDADVVVAEGRELWRHRRDDVDAVRLTSRNGGEQDTPQDGRQTRAT